MTSIEARTRSASSAAVPTTIIGPLVALPVSLRISGDALAQLDVSRMPDGHFHCYEERPSNESVKVCDVPAVVPGDRFETAPRIRMLTRDGLYISTTMDEVTKDEPGRYMAQLE